MTLFLIKVRKLTCNLHSYLIQFNQREFSYPRLCRIYKSAYKSHTEQTIGTSYMQTFLTGWNMHFIPSSTCLNYWRKSLTVYFTSIPPKYTRDVFKWSFVIDTDYSLQLNKEENYAYGDLILDFGFELCLNILHPSLLM